MRTSPEYAPLGAAWRIPHKGASRCLSQGALSSRPFYFPPLSARDLDSKGNIMFKSWSALSAFILATATLHAAPGDLDTSFNPPSINGTICSVAVQSNGKILICGSFYTIGTAERWYIARLNEDGSLDTSFSYPGLANRFNESGYYVYAYPTENKVIFGNSSGIKRLNSNGSLDTTFNPPNLNSSYGCVQPDGKVIILGDLGNPKRLQSNGALDTGYQGSVSFNSYIETLILDHNNNLYVGGLFTKANGYAYSMAAKIMSDGVLSGSFVPTLNTDSSTFVGSLAIDTENRVLLAGILQSGNNCFRYKANGSLDTSFSAQPRFWQYDALLALPNGNVIASGRGTWPESRFYSNCMDSTGALDASFANPSYDDNVVCMALQANGDVIVAGKFTAVKGVARSHIARIKGYPVTYPITINTHPVSQTVEEGNPVTFSVVATSSQPLSYQWRNNGVDIIGATKATYTISQTSLSDAGQYMVEVRNSTTTANSSTALLTVNPKPTEPATIQLHMIAGLTIKGQIGAPYRIDYCTDLTNPVWMQLTTVTLPYSPYNYVDWQSTPGNRRFYRAIAQ